MTLTIRDKWLLAKQSRCGQQEGGTKFMDYLVVASTDSFESNQVRFMDWIL